MLLKLLKRYKKKEDGVTAIEFSLLAIPYLLLTLGLIELSVMYASASLLEGATSSAARLIRTGQIQQDDTGAGTETLFRDAICSYATVLINCNDVVIEIQEMESFGDFDAMAPVYDSDGNLVSQGVDAGGADSRVLIRAAYRYDLMTPLVGPLMGGPDGSRLFMSTIVLQSEPYDFDGAGY